MRSRITFVVAATTSAVVLSFVIPLCLLVRTLAEDRAMAAADQEARNIAILVSTFDHREELPELVEAADRATGARTSLLLDHGEVLGSSAPNMASDPDVILALEGTATSSRTSSGGKLVFPVIASDGTEVVMSTVDAQEMHRGVTRAWVIIIGLGLGLVAAALFIANVMGRRISRPLFRVAETAHQLRAGNLAARAEVEGPQETEELAEALNGLADRIDDLLAAERASVADLSHRLRTPVTALRLDAESVADTGLSGRLQDHIAVLQRDIDAIVNEARRPVRQSLRASCDATAVVRERVEFWRVLAEDQQRPLSVLLTQDPLPVAVGESDLRDLVDILIDNVFAHTAEGVAFSVTLQKSETDAVLIVADRGSGVAGSARSEQRVGSTGLGLEIVRRTARAAGGRVRIGSSNGTTIEVRLPSLMPPK